MKKMKMFFVAAALMLVTVGVFAGKAKFFTDTDLYYYNPTSGSMGFGAISTSISLFSGFSVSTSSANALKVEIPSINSGAAVGLYTFVSGTPGQYEFIVD